MITVGVDLATEPAKTAIAVLRWSATGAAVQSLVLDVDDAAIANAASDADKLGEPIAMRELRRHSIDRPRVAAIPSKFRSWKTRQRSFGTH